MTNTPIVTRTLIVTRVGGQGPPRYPFTPALRPDVHRDYYNDLHRYSPTFPECLCPQYCPRRLNHFSQLIPLRKVLIICKLSMFVHL